MPQMGGLDSPVRPQTGGLKPRRADAVRLPAALHPMLMNHDALAQRGMTSTVVGMEPCGAVVATPSFRFRRQAAVMVVVMLRRRDGGGDVMTVTTASSRWRPSMPVMVSLGRIVGGPGAMVMAVVVCAAGGGVSTRLGVMAMMMVNGLRRRLRRCVVMVVMRGRERDGGAKSQYRYGDSQNDVCWKSHRHTPVPGGVYHA